MTKIRSLMAASLLLSAGAWATSCASFSSGGGDGSGGSGPSTGSGGTSSGSGGQNSGSGGESSGSGGTTGAGGVSSSGGNTGSGGVANSGGSTGAGGTISGVGGHGIGGTGAGGSTTGSGGTMGAGGTMGTGGMAAATLPCDVLNAAGNNCVAAHSTVRLLVSGYTGPLYQVCKGTFKPGPSSCSGTTKDIASVDGYADAASQDTFCSGGSCTISIIYDQSGMKNDLRPAPAGGTVKSPDNPVSATALPLMAGGHKVYGVSIKTGTGYRSGCNACMNTKPNGTATGDQPETEYMVTSQNGYNNGCCFDYGNAETSANDDGNGTMEAVYYGSGVVWGTGSPGGRNNPWVMADLENGLYAGWQNNSDQNITTNTPLKFDYVTAVLVGDTADKNSGKGRFALYGGDATQGPLSVKYDSVRPNKTGYAPMKKQGSIILGIGGDNSNGDTGEFFEGVMASGAASMTTLNAMQAAIVTAGYGK